MKITTSLIVTVITLMMVAAVRPMTAQVSEPGSSPVFDGYNLFAPIRSTDTYLMDNDGEVVHSWTGTSRPGLSVYLLNDATLLRTATTGEGTFDVGGAGGRIELLAWDGTVSWSFDYSTGEHRQHHDVEYLPNGNVLLVAWEHKTQAEAIAAGRNPSLLRDGELWPDHVVEVDPGTDAIVWEWHVWDHLVQDYDLTKQSFGSVVDHPELVDINFVATAAADWTHVNAIAYNAELDQILLSVHNFSEIWIIDHSTTSQEAAGHTGGASGKGGDLLYRWGNPRAYDADTAADQQLFVQHDAEWIADDLPGAGNILVFNNGTGRPGGSFSSVDELVPPLQADGSYGGELPFGPDAPVWSYQASPTSELYAERISGSQRLGNGNTLICDGPAGRFFEVTSNGEVVWEYEYGSDVFRVERYDPSFTGLDPEDTPDLSYPLVDTGQHDCFDASTVISPPTQGEPFAGQDAQYAGNQPSYTVGDDGLTVMDNVTGLTWMRSADSNGDGEVKSTDKKTWAELDSWVTALNTVAFGGYSDWRVPTIKELYSLIDFSGTDPATNSTDTTGLTPFLNTDYFAFGYGDVAAGERIIDAQYWSSTEYVSTTMNGNATVFGVNFADGRIKGYPRDTAASGGERTQYLLCVRGNPDYGVNEYVDNGDGTVTDRATGLMWQQADSGAGMSWEEALAWAEGLELAGYSDWRLPNAKELQSIVDYTRSPDTTASAAVDPAFSATQITNEAGAVDYPAYWTGTTHANASPTPGRAAAYLCFGRGMGYMFGSWLDVHGAGCQRSDPKEGDLEDYTYVPAGYYFGNAPQGDAIRITNYVRCVREAPESTDMIFADDFESGDTSHWSATSP